MPPAPAPATPRWPLPPPRQLLATQRCGHADVSCPSPGTGLLVLRCLVAIKFDQFQLRERNVPFSMERSPSFSGIQIAGNTSAPRSRGLSSGVRSLAGEFKASRCPDSGRGLWAFFSQTQRERFKRGGPRRGRVQSGLTPPWSRGPSHCRHSLGARFCLAVTSTRPISIAKQENFPHRRQRDDL